MSKDMPPTSIDKAAVRALFSDYSPNLTRTAAELEDALYRRGYAGTLVEWLPALRAAGLREPRRGVFGMPEQSSSEVYTLTASEIVADLSNLADDNSRDTIEAVAAPNALKAPLFSYFRGGIRTATPYAAITPRQLWQVIQSPRFALVTALLRQAPAGSEQRAEQKKTFDYVTPAGTFAPTRANGNLQASSGLLVLDFDHLPDVPAARAALLSDTLLQPGLVLLFTSPGGEGLKAILEADSTASHLDNFRILAGYLAGCYGPELQPDPSGKDVARACFVCHDADAWLSPRFAE
jgi:hypothetical protein